MPHEGNFGNLIETEDRWQHAAPVGESAGLIISATPLGNVCPSSIPPRQWLFGDQLLRGYVSAFVAPPGVGKSTLTMQFAIAVATGADFAGLACHEQGNVWIYNNEDDRDELHRRIVAAASVMDAPLDQLANKVFLDTGDERALLIARADRDGNVTQTPDVAACVDEIRQHDIKLFVVDPFAETHTVNENSNDEIIQVAAMYRRIAKEGNCSVLLVHHTRKTANGMDGGVAGSMDSARGAGAFAGVCRVVSTMFGMSKLDADLHGVQEDDRYLYVRFDGAKANLALVTNRARWFQRESVDLPNGDKVGALMPWTPPGPFEGITAHDLIAIQKLVQSRVDDGNAYGPSSRSGENWIGAVIANRCGLDADDDRKRIQAVFKEWTANEMFAVEKLPNANHDIRAAVVVKNWASI